MTIFSLLIPNQSFYPQRTILNQNENGQKFNIFISSKNCLPIDPKHGKGCEPDGKKISKIDK